MKVQAKCISKNRNTKGVIVSYTLQDQSGQQKIVVTGQQIKKAIAAGKIDIINLQIDKAGRLIDKTECETITSEKKNDIDFNKREKQAEIFVSFIEDIKISCDDFNIEDMGLKNKDNKEKILDLCEKRFPNKRFRCNHKELVKQYSYGEGISRVDWRKVNSIENDVMFNEIFANFMYGNLTMMLVKFADDWCFRHEYDLIMGGECDLEETEEIIDEENEHNNKLYDKLKELIKEYEKKYGMFMKYTIEDGYITITAVEFR